MNNLAFRELLQKYNSGKCSDLEKQLIESWYAEYNSSEPHGLAEEQMEEIMAMKAPVIAERRHENDRRWISIAAAIVIITSVTAYFLFTPSPGQEIRVAKIENDINPGSNKAILTLADGKKIMLNDAKNGMLTHQANAMVGKAADGHVVYSPDKNNTDNQPVQFNTMSVPRGGQYHLTLIDGTQVWLNAGSSISFPTRFTGNERKVEVKGEAYFEVAHQPEQPFRVFSKGQVIEVLGTHFNLSAYDDEPSSKTTLLQGAVSIKTSGNSRILKPGDQAVLSKDAIVLTRPDLEEVMAWHEGDFVFKKQTVEEIMRKVSRWYDVDVQYEGYHSNQQTFTGVVSRSKNLSSVIQMMKASSNTLKFHVNGKIIVISN